MLARGRIFTGGLAALLGSALPVVAAAQFGLPATPVAEPNASACRALTAVALPELVSLESDWLDAGPIDPLVAAASGMDATVALAAHCRVRGVIAPAIRFELWLPAAQDWNGRFLGHGSSDLGGEIAYAALLSSLEAGYAGAASDDGHRAGDRDWLGDDARLRDFAYRSLFETTAKAASLLDRFYGRPADFRYFNGCGQGGRQALVAAERFPGAFDGIVAGQPMTGFVDAALTRLWAARAAEPLPGQRLLSADLLARVNAAAIDQCDTLDGVRDGTLEDPRRCNFDPARLQCGLTAGASCLTPGEVAAVRDIYAGPRNVGTTGSALPGLVPGSETGWRFAASGGPDAATLEFLRHAIDADPFWDWRAFDFGADADRAREQAAWILDATGGDLSGFRQRGGHLIAYQGWNDTAQSPEATIAWYESLDAANASVFGTGGGTGPGSREGVDADSGIATGTPAIRDFARLFMVPGMAECSGGRVDFDAQIAIENWVERGIAPDRIEAEQQNGTDTRVRPLCPYPEIARYRGTGNTDRAGSFVCSN